MDEKPIKRIMPHSQEAEQSVIGSMLMDQKAINDAIDIVKAEDFYIQQYAMMFEAMVALTFSIASSIVTPAICAPATFI